MNLTAPPAHRHPFWTGIDFVRTSDTPIDFWEYLGDWVLYVYLKNPPPTSTVTYVVEDKF